MMRPYIICHMMSLLDGRIDCDVTEQIESGDEYYDALNQLDCPSTLMGRVTMQMHYALPDVFVAEDSSPIGEEQFHIAICTKGYLIAIDTIGKLRWAQNQFDGIPLLVITSKDCPKEYLDTLSKQHISWIATGKAGIDLARAMEILYKEFNVERLSLTGGGHINGAFLKAGLIDEVSMMWCPGIDGRKGMASVFDGLDTDTPPTKIQLISVEKMGEIIWAKYKPQYTSKTKIFISIFTESGTEITSSHRSSNGFVYSGYNYSKPIVYSSLPFKITEENAIRIKEKLTTYRLEVDFESDWGISFGRSRTYFSEIETIDFTDFLNSLEIQGVLFVANAYNEDNVDGCLLNVSEKEIFTTRYKKHDLEWYFQTLPILKEHNVNYRSVLNDLLQIAKQDISKFIDDNDFFLAKIPVSGNSWINAAQICDNNGELLDCIKNSNNEEVVKIKELIRQGYTYRALNKDYSLNIDVMERINLKKFYEDHGAFSFR